MTTPGCHLFGPAGVGLGLLGGFLGPPGVIKTQGRVVRIKSNVLINRQTAAYIYYPAAGLVTLHAPRD